MRRSWLSTSSARVRFACIVGALVATQVQQQLTGLRPRRTSLLVRRSSGRARAIIAAVAAIAQLFVITHATFIDHALSASGELVETKASVETTHRHDAASWCSAEPHFGASLDTCTVARNTHAARLTVRLVSPLTPLIAAMRSNEHRRLALEPIGVLIRSPKASPPFLG